jgi:hypothetical protein
MAAYDRTSGSAGAPSRSDARERRVHLDWSAIFGGAAIGWGVLLLLSLIGVALGLAAIDPYSTRPAEGGDVASSVWAAIAMIVTAALGAYFVVRFAGDRRRNESLLHGAVAWGVSMLAGALIALFSAGAASIAAGHAAARRAAPRERVTSTGRARLDSAKDAAARTSGIGAGGALLALVGSLFGALIGASRQSGVSLKNEFRLETLGVRRKQADGHATREPPARDETTILPPTH